MDYINSTDRHDIVWHDMINMFIRTKKVPHELYFINLLINEIIKDNKLAEKFITYVIQYHPDYHWTSFDLRDYTATAIINLSFSNLQFEKLYKFKDKELKSECFNKAMIMGEYATDFLIRYQGYSLVKCQGQNIIITAQSDCHKRFEKLLYKGYSLHRKSKIGWIDVYNHEYIKGVFYKLPVLPTKDIGCPIDEIIETSLEDDSYARVLSLKK